MDERHSQCVRGASLRFIVCYGVKDPGFETLQADDFRCLAHMLQELHQVL